ncbi:hypothetical protein GQ55_9G201100 [Panicum hallii var. hallii]|uniref:Secreted protein n=1 Tax=Panicum hallii var. hallii TaxID=1504633 RepID=A0A2T7C5H6_9POAL|nr:hypothetical protein GQ55_9G201100 [Panicum hallii var. hallii]
MLHISGSTAVVCLLLLEKHPQCCCRRALQSCAHHQSHVRSLTKLWCLMSQAGSSCTEGTACHRRSSHDCCSSQNCWTCQGGVGSRCSLTPKLGRCANAIGRWRE